MAQDWITLLKHISFSARTLVPLDNNNKSSKLVGSGSFRFVIRIVDKML